MKKTLVTLLLLLINGIFIGLIFENIDKPGPTTPNVIVKNSFSEVSSVALQYYYNNDKSYEGFKETVDWKNLRRETPECYEDYLKKHIPDLDPQYRLNISNDGESYVLWAPLCGKTKDEEQKNAFFSKHNLLSLLPFTNPDISDYLVYYCLDSEENELEHKGNPVNLEATNCEELFNN